MVVYSLIEGKIDELNDKLKERNVFDNFESKWNFGDCCGFVILEKKRIRENFVRL